MSELDWRDTTIGNICAITTGKLDVNASEEEGAYPFFTCAERVYRINEFAFDTEAVLFAGNGFFNVKYYKGKFNAYQRTYVLHQLKLNGRYLFHYISHRMGKITGGSRGSTIKYIRLADLRDHPIRVPSLETQVRIVAEIETQLSRLDEAVANLQRVKANLKRYKASVLSEFFDSKVSGWRKCQLKTVCQVISGFAFKSTDFSRDGVPVVKIANIGYGEFHWKDQEYLPSSFLESQRAFAIQPCDLLMALTRPITNGTLKVCLYPHDAPVALLNQRVAVLRVGVDLGREFLLLMMQSAAFKNQLQDALSETLQPNLSPVDLKNFEISIPSGPEQARIVAEVDRHLSIIREVEAEVDANLQRAQALRQSTLSSAFSPKP